MDLSYDQTIECIRTSSHTIDSLIAALTRLKEDEGLPGDTLIVLANDADPAPLGFSPLVRAAGVERCMFLPHNTWAGEHFLNEETRRSLSDAWNPAPPESIPAVVLWPTN